MYATLLLHALVVQLLSASQFCHEQPSEAAHSLSLGRPAEGRLQGAVALIDSATARVLPHRHAARCLRFGTARLVHALHEASARVQQLIPHTPPLGVGDLARAQGGPILPYSRSHQSGRDADVGFYAHSPDGRPVVANDLLRFTQRLRTIDGTAMFDVQRNWQLVRALLEAPDIEVQWLFVAPFIVQALLREAERDGAPSSLLSRARALLHQPSDAKLHDDHLHIRIRCNDAERLAGCVD